MLDTLREMRELIEKLNNYTKAYDAGTPLISDKEWDDLYFRLKKIEESSGIILGDSPTQSIPFTQVSALEKVQHNHPMLSLDKTKSIEDIRRFAKRPIIAMCKMDGLTCSLLYRDGKLVRAETRGNGEIGEDITHNALQIKSIPKSIAYPKELVVDGEVICTYKDFEPFASEYKNPRNFASGSIRLLNSKESASRNLTFVAWDCITDLAGCQTLSAKLQSLHVMGFTVVPYTSGDPQDCIDEIKECAEQAGYPIDGVVFKYDNCEYYTAQGMTGHHAKGGIAYKFYDEVYPTKLLGIDYNVSRNGVLTPVALFEPIEIEGSIVGRSSLHNFSVLKNLCAGPIYVGDSVGVYKANLIIPQILIWENDGTGSEITPPKTCPACGAATEMIESDTGVLELHCTNPDCSCRLINKLDHFASRKAMDIKGLSKATLEKLINWGWIDSIYDIYKLSEHSSEWKRKPGFGVASVNKVLEAIENSKNCTLNQFITAIDIPLIGSTIAKDLVKHFPTWQEFRNAIKTDYPFWKLPGFGVEMDAAITSFNYTEADKLAQLMNFNSEEIVEVENTLDGMSICITGKLKQFKNRDAFIAAVEVHGGKVSSSVSRKTAILVNNDAESESSKNKTAKSYNIPILTEQEFIEKYLK